MFTSSATQFQCRATADACRQVPVEIRAKMLGAALKGRLEALESGAHPPGQVWTATYRIRKPEGHALLLWVVAAGDEGVMCLDDDGCEASRRCVIHQKVRARLAPVGSQVRVEGRF